MTTKSNTHKMNIGMAASKEEMRDYFKDSSSTGGFCDMGDAAKERIKADVEEHEDPFQTIIGNYYVKQCEDVTHPTRVRDGNEMLRHFKQVVVKRVPANLAEFVRRSGKEDALCLGVIPWIYRLTSGLPTSEDRQRWTDMFDDEAPYFKMLNERFNEDGRIRFIPHITHTLDSKQPVMMSVIVCRFPKEEPVAVKSNAPSLD